MFGHVDVQNSYSAPRHGWTDKSGSGLVEAYDWMGPDTLADADVPSRGAEPALRGFNSPAA